MLIRTHTVNPPVLTHAIHACTYSVLVCCIHVCFIKLLIAVTNFKYQVLFLYFPLLYV